jgi:predicted kinase
MPPDVEATGLVAWHVMAQRATLLLLAGLPGAGKTTFAQALVAARPGLIHVESDRIRRELFRVPRYTDWEHGQVFAEAGRRVETALAASADVIVDATNLNHRDRRRFIQLAAKHAARLLGVQVVAPAEVIRARLAEPRDGYSQADARVFEAYLRLPFEPFRCPAITVDTTGDTVASLRLLLHLMEE